MAVSSRRLQRAVLILSATLASATGCFGAGCDGKPLRFEDKFVNLANWPSFSKLSEVVVAKEGGLAISLANGKTVGDLYHGDVFGDGDICVVVRLIQSNVPKGSTSGTFSLRFWGQDNPNIYALAVSPEQGLFRVDRCVAGRWLGATWAKSPAIKGVGEDNVVRVSVRGTEAKYYINDQEVQPASPLAVHPPEGGSLVGWAVGSMQDAQYVWRVSSFRVTK